MITVQLKMRDLEWLLELGTLWYLETLELAIDMGRKRSIGWRNYNGKQSYKQHFRYLAGRVGTQLAR